MFINLSRTRCHRRVSGGNASGGGGGWSAAAAAMIQKRKERNRVSAAKCRDKQKKRYHNLETEKLSLSRDNEALLREVEQLERERKHLETMILTHSETCCDSICTPTIEALPPHPSHTDPLAHSPPVPASCPGSFIQTSILMASHSENNDDDTEMMTSRDDDS